MYPRLYSCQAVPKSELASAKKTACNGGQQFDRVVDSSSCLRVRPEFLADPDENQRPHNGVPVHSHLLPPCVWCEHSTQIGTIGKST